MNRAYSQPRALALSWFMLLLAPVSWAAALGILWSLTDETCARGHRGPMLGVAVLCVLLAFAPAPVGWIRRRSVDAASAAGQRLRFMLTVAAGGSAIFALTMLLTTASILLLSPCRT